jgi:hypothetical protein
MATKIIDNNEIVSFDSISSEEDLNLKPRININPPPGFRRCDSCGRHISELKPFGKAGYPLVGDFEGALLIKKFRPMEHYYEKAETAWDNAEKQFVDAIIKDEHPLEVMSYWVDWIRIKIFGSHEYLNAFLDYWWTWSNKNLRCPNTRPTIRLESKSEFLVIDIDSIWPDYFSLGIFDILPKKFHRLNFVLDAGIEDIGDEHVLFYQNGEKIIHFQKYVEINGINKNGSKELIDEADHVNKKLQILEERIHDGDGVYDKSFTRVYENCSVTYQRRVFSDVAYYKNEKEIQNWHHDEQYDRYDGDDLLTVLDNM